MTATLPEEMHERWHTFVERINEVAHDVFGEDDDLFLVLGAQWNGISWGEDGNPECLLTSNLPLCLIADAIEDMHAEAVRLHESIHGDGMKPDGTVTQRVSLDNVPEEVREAALAFAAEHGIPPEDVAFVEVADASDLLDLPLFRGEADEDNEQHVRGDN